MTSYLSICVCVYTISSLFALQFQIASRRASVNKYRRKICREIRNARHVYIGGVP